MLTVCFFLLLLGAHYLDGTSGNDKKDDQVQPGVTKMVDWQVTSEFAPRDGDPNCVPFAYHSHNNVGREENTGLIGLFTVCKQGNYNEPVHEISNNVVCATSKASDQPGHTRSLIRAVASRLSIL